jgi:ubiquinone/menaquinone biosynthesis C-methylase UbiE
MTVEERDNEGMLGLPLINRRLKMNNIVIIAREAVSSVLEPIYRFVLFGRRASMVPPTRLMYDGPRSILTFKKNGEEFLRCYIEFCDLKPNEKILDVGSGIGRKTIPLTKYLDEKGRYEGFDIFKQGIDWCRERISKKYTNFHFQLADVSNNLYNPEGKYKASEYRFPFEDESFDFVVLGSVFTHMLPEDMENYSYEIARVLKKDGRCLITYFLINRESLELVNAKKSSLDFSYDLGKFRTVDANKPELAVGYDESFILNLYDKYGLKIKGPIHYGSWCGRREFLSYQDIVIAIKA